MKKKEREEIFKNGYSLIDYPIDMSMDGEQETNGSIEHVVEFNKEYYFVQVSWTGAVGRVIKIDRKLQLEAGGFIAKAIRNFEENETK